MKKLFQSLGDGSLEIVEGPEPTVGAKSLLIKSNVSLISAGTERMLLGFGKSSMLSKARQQPEKVKEVLGKVKTDGVATTLEAVRSKLAEPIPLGYSSVGRVAAVGSGVHNFKVGDLVVSNGNHGDVVVVGQNLCAKIPENVSAEHAAFTVVASIGLQGIRLSQPTLGESFVVTGVGVIGLLVVQMLIAQGCRVLAIDFDDNKLSLAKEFGAEICNPGKGADPVAAGMAFSRGAGVDGVIITASTDSNEPVSQAAQMCRKRGRIVLIGVIGLALNRADFYEKELSFQVSCSYGPGRYDPQYEEQGIDYPVGFVRWTEQRNFEAVLDLLSAGRLNVERLITASFKFEDAKEAYDKLISDRDALGILFEYTHDEPAERMTRVKLSAGKAAPANKGALVTGFVGAGNYASRMLIPAFRANGSTCKTLVTSGGMSAAIQGEKAGFEYASTDVQDIFKDPDTNIVAVATRHNTHAKFVLEALESGKHIFIEKPLALTVAEVESIVSTRDRVIAEKGHVANVMVGFNRRYSPHVVKMKGLLDQRVGPATFIFTMNAGAIPADHWTQNLKSGGGRIIGEACHYIDLMRHFAGAAIASVHAVCISNAPGQDVLEDKAIITLTFEDGSIGSIHYFANGSALFPKERIESFCEGQVLQLDNFVKLTGYGYEGFKKQKTWKQEKGQKECVASFLGGVKDGTGSPIPFDEVVEVALAAIEADRQLRGG